MSNETQHQRTIRTVHRAQRADMDNLPTVRPLPTSKLSQQDMDPFIFLNHHGPTQYPPGNDGLPFEPHPHRGMQTVTFIVDGDVLHRDNVSGEESIIEAGGVQWMVAGEGLLHLETSSERFQREGGDVEILQLWVNLPSEHKSVQPTYVGLQDGDIPVVKSDDGKTRTRVITGSVNGQQGAMEALTDVEMYWIDFDKQGVFETEIDASKRIFLYVVQGAVEVNGESVDAMNLVEFDDDGDHISMRATDDSLVLLGHATPYDEPIVARGPFVMNSAQEIEEAYRDLRSGGFGTWP